MKLWENYVRRRTEAALEAQRVREIWVQEKLQSLPISPFLEIKGLPSWLREYIAERGITNAFELEQDLKSWTFSNTHGGKLEPWAWLLEERQRLCEEYDAQEVR